MVVYVAFVNKDERVGSLMAGTYRPGSCGPVSNRNRRGHRPTLDPQGTIYVRFFRDRVDARQALIDLAESVRRASSVFELSQLTRYSVERALHPSGALFLLSPASTNFTLRTPHLRRCRLALP